MILISFRFLQDGTEVQCFVAQSMDQVVGVALLRREEVCLRHEVLVLILPYADNVKSLESKNR